MFGDVITKGRAIILCGVVIFSILVPVVHGAEIKVGYVDMQRALNESDAGKEAKVVMESEYQKFQSQIAQRQKELQAFQQTLQKQGLMLSDKARQEKEKEYRSKLKEFKRWGEDRQAELKQKEMDLTKATLKGLGATVRKLGEEEKFALILEKNEAVILFASKAIDLTDRVIQIFNATGKK